MLIVALRDCYDPRTREINIKSACSSEGEEEEEEDINKKIKNKIFIQMLTLAFSHTENREDWNHLLR